MSVARFYHDQRFHGEDVFVEQPGAKTSSYEFRFELDDDPRNCVHEDVYALRKRYARKDPLKGEDFSERQRGLFTETDVKAMRYDGYPIFDASLENGKLIAYPYNTKAKRLMERVRGLPTVTSGGLSVEFY